MRTRIVIALLGIVAVLAWTGMAGAQTTTAAPMVTLPSGKTVWDLAGEWEAVFESYGPRARYGTLHNVYRITQTGTTFDAIRLQDNLPPERRSRWGG
jgi:hypothetical protein